MFHECYFDVAMGFGPRQQVFQSCRDETTDSLMLHSSMEEIKVSCVWAQHGANLQSMGKSTILLNPIFKPLG